MSKVAPYYKAVLAFIVPGVVVLAGALAPGSAGGEGVTSTEWLTALFACILTSRAVYTKTNAPLNTP